MPTVMETPGRRRTRWRPPALPQAQHLALELTLVALLALATPALQDVQSAVQAVTTFSNSLVPKLYQALAPGRENLVFAPFGLATNLAMLLEAADGPTADEILRTFSIAPDARDELRQGFKAYFDTFEHAAAAAAESGEAAGAFNTAMLRSASILSPEYKTLLAKYYRANITEVPHFDNFTGAQPAALALELRTDSGVMSHWRDYQRLGVFTFLSQRGAAPFQRAPGDAVAVPMVPQVGVFRSGRLDHLACSAVELQLQVGAVSLLLLVPDAADAMDELLVKLSGVQFAHLPAWLAWGEREVALPQLAVLSAGLDLAPFLRQLGLRRALNASLADLGRARPRPAIGPELPRLYLKSVIQDAYFSTSFVAVNSVGSVSANLGERAARARAFSFAPAKRTSISPLYLQYPLVRTRSKKGGQRTQHHRSMTASVKRVQLIRVGRATRTLTATSVDIDDFARAANGRRARR